MFNFLKRDPQPIDFTVKQSIVCPLCGTKQYWHMNECVTCKYLEPAWNKAHTFVFGPLEHRYFRTMNV